MPQVTCPSCAKGVEVTDDQMGGQHTCEVCGSEFNLSLQPEDADAPENVTMSMGQVFHERPDPDPPSEEAEAWNSAPFVILAIVIVLGLMAYLLL